jgi:methoxymalonate biosynthesis protein
MDTAVTGPVESGRVEPGTVEPGTVEPGRVKAGAVKAGTVKCVVWDIDNTLLAGVYLESGAEPPPADPGMATVLRELAGRGILHAIASRNPPAAAEHAAQVTGCEFAAAECGWGRKSDAVARIAAELNIAAGALAFVDDDPYERAEVTFALPPVLVLSPEDMADAVGWPEFSPSVVTPEGRRRGAMYAQRRRRLAAQRSFGGSREEFLRSCDTRVTIAAASAADVPRLHELSERTSQFNSAGAGLAEDEFGSLISSPASGVLTVRLRDTFGDDGLVGGCVTEHGTGTWTVRLLMMSCRAMGRGVIEALLAWLARSAAREGAQALEVPCALNDRNVPLRLALAAAGFRAAANQAAPGQAARGQAAPGQAARGQAAPGQAARSQAARGQVAGGQAAGGQAAGQATGRGGLGVPGGAVGPGRAVFRLDLGGPLPELPGWATGPGEP